MPPFFVFLLSPFLRRVNGFSETVAVFVEVVILRNIELLLSLSQYQAEQICANTINAYKWSYDENTHDSRSARSA